MTALIDHIKAGGRVTTRLGRPVVIYRTDAPSEHPVHGCVDGEPDPMTWGADGTFMRQTFGVGTWDLIPAGPTIVDEMVEALKLARDRFREYAALHAAKPDMEKAKRNSDMADICDAALAKAGAS